MCVHTPPQRAGGSGLRHTEILNILKTNTSLKVPDDTVYVRSPKKKKKKYTLGKNIALKIERH